MSVTKGQLERRMRLRKHYEQGIPAPRAIQLVGLTEQTVYRWYHRWAQEAGDEAVKCECGRPLIHAGRCVYRRSQRTGAAAMHRAGTPVYDGPDLIGRAMTAEEVAAFRARNVSML